LSEPAERPCSDGLYLVYRVIGDAFDWVLMMKRDWRDVWIGEEGSGQLYLFWGTGGRDWAYRTRRVRETIREL
jgi:hypothetical protein